jgi:hypothetical protein
MTDSGDALSESLVGAQPHRHLLGHVRRHRSRCLRDTVAALRAVRGSAWKNMADPLAELADLRRDGDDELY